MHDQRNYTFADVAYERILRQVKEFQDFLDDDHEVGVLLASFGQPTMLQVTGFGFANPNILYFYGTINGEKAQLIQHMNQLNFVLVAVQKADPQSPPRRVGFSLPSSN